MELPDLTEQGLYDLTSACDVYVKERITGRLGNIVGYEGTGRHGTFAVFVTDQLELDGYERGTMMYLSFDELEFVGVMTHE